MHVCGVRVESCSKLRVEFVLHGMKWVGSVSGLGSEPEHPWAKMQPLCRTASGHLGVSCCEWHERAETEDKPLVGVLTIAPLHTSDTGRGCIYW